MASHIIRTVMGPVEPSEWGSTSMQDYIQFNGSAEGDRLRSRLPAHPFAVQPDDMVSLENIGALHRNYVLCKDAVSQIDPAALTEEARQFKRVGGQAILDLAVPGVGIDPEAVRSISCQSGVHIVTSTGDYTRESWPENLTGLCVNAHHNRMLREIAEGIGGTSVRPGHIAVMLSNFTKEERVALQAAARVADETGLSITVGQSNPAGYLDDAILAVLNEEGVSPDRVILGGIPVTTQPPIVDAIRDPKLLQVDIARASRLTERGYTLSFSFANTRMLELLGDYDKGDWPDLSGLVKLIEAGYADRLVLGNDCRGKITLHNSGGEGYCRMLYFTVPTLRDVAGISEYAIHQMLVCNPARLLSAPQW